MGILFILASMLELVLINTFSSFSFSGSVHALALIIWPTRESVIAKYPDSLSRSFSFTASFAKSTAFLIDSKVPLDSVSLALHIILYASLIVIPKYSVYLGTQIICKSWI